MKPIIGLNGNIALKDSRPQIQLCQNYSQAVELAGGIPVLLPPTEDDELVRRQLDMVQGLLLVGGPDYDPKLYGYAPHPKYRPQIANRTAFDIKLSNAALHQGLPIFGVCAGVQLINIIRGGTLFGHIPELDGVDEEHEGCWDGHAHDVIIEKRTRLADIVGAENLGVNSTHHQAVEHLGKGLRVAARSPDGVIEALESTQPDEFLLGVQWHPERLTRHPRHLALFEALVRAACS